MAPLIRAKIAEKAFTVPWAPASLAAKVLKDMGFTNVSILEGGTNGWKAAGLETVAPDQNK